MLYLGASVLKAGHSKPVEYNDNRLYEVTVKRPSQADRVFTYTYDAGGRLEKIVYPSSTGIEARFDDGAMTPNMMAVDPVAARHRRLQKSSRPGLGTSYDTSIRAYQRRQAQYVLLFSSQHRSNVDYSGSGGLSKTHGP